MIESYEKDFSTIDFAVNNAGIFTGDAAIDISPEAFNSVIDVNLNGVFFTAQAAARLMVKHNNGGSIISTASMSAHIINVPQTIANYCATKAGVVHFTKAWQWNGQSTNSCELYKSRIYSNGIDRIVEGSVSDLVSKNARGQQIGIS